MTQIIEGHFRDELQSRYLTYALSTIMSRALPDVRDGLKPVHRRLLYAMHMLRLDPDKGYKKCARVVGDVIGKYHPHGDMAVYDAMVRLAQDFSVRYPLVDGQGNFGSIDGDSAAAMRYTEARLTEVARWIMKDIDSGTVDFQPNYDESDEEPIVMPSCFPNLLANGSSGIAVGLSTSIPPHNVGELCNALVALIKNPNMRDETLLNHIQGPDFPTGGILTENQDAIAAAYASGKGSFRLRARWEKEDLGRGQWQIIVTELPYQVNKSRLVEKIADLMHKKRLPWLADVMDESAEDIRLVLEPKSKNVDPVALMETMYRLTELENRISLNMYVITGQRKPACLSLKSALQEFADHRRDVLIRKSTFRSEKIQERLHILDAYLVVYLNIDEVIEIIKNNDKPAPIMMERFGIDEVQANAILDMRLRRLRKLEEMEIRTEYDGLKAELAILQAILASEEEQSRVLIEEMKDIKKQFSDARRTSLAEAPVAEIVPLEAMVEKEPLTILLSREGWVRAMKGHITEDAKYKEGDEELFRLHTQSTDTICLITNIGKVFSVTASKLPSGRGFGEPLRLIVEMSQEEKAPAMFVPQHKQYLLSSRQGQGFLVDADSLSSFTRTGKQVMNISKGDDFYRALPATGDCIAAIGTGGKLLVYPMAEVPTLSKGKGVRLMMLKNQELHDICIFNAQTGFGLISNTGKRKQTFAGTEMAPWLGKRAQVGKVLPLGFKGGAELFAPEAPAEEGADQQTPPTEGDKGEQEPQNKTSQASAPSAPAEPEHKVDRLDELLKEIAKPKKAQTEEEREAQIEQMNLLDD